MSADLHLGSTGSLPPGLIFEIARAGGMEVEEKGTKVPCCCPFHDDANASAFLSSNNVFYCSVCTPDGGWTAKRFAEALNVPWTPPLTCDALPKRPVTPPAADGFTPSQARDVWSRALARALDDDRVEADQAVYDYLAGRGLMEAWDLRLVGILSEDSDLPPSISWWPNASYRIVAPLYDSEGGELVGIQARAIEPRDKRVLAPKGGRMAKTLFANAAGLALLRGEWDGDKRALLAEGLTDMLALSIVAPVPVLSAPGTGSLVNSIGAWVRGLDVYLAADADDAGEKAVQPTAARIFACGGRRVVRVAWSEPCKDACDALQQLGAVELDHQLRRLIEEGPRGRHNAA